LIDCKQYRRASSTVAAIIVLYLGGAYAPQVGRHSEEKEAFYALLGKVVVEMRVGEGLMVGGDFNGHVGEEIDGFTGVHGGNGYGTRNAEGELLLEFAESLGLAIGNTWWKKPIKKMVTYSSGGNKSVVDYVLVRGDERQNVTDITVIPNEPCLLQHKLVICDVRWGRVEKRRKETFVGKCRLWKLKDTELCRQFEDGVRRRAELREGEGAECIWRELKGCMLEEAEKVCGMTKGPRRHEETWWWNDEIGEAVDEKRRLYLIKEQTKSKGDITEYMRANRIVKKLVARAQERETHSAAVEMEQTNRNGNIFRIAKNIVRKNKDVVSGSCVKDSNGRLVVEEEKVRSVWKKYYKKLLNEEFA
jgi:hypothetical protein